MSIPWDTHIEDDPAPIPADRPAWLPYCGEPVDAETAARIMARYGPEIAAALERIAGVVRARHNEAAITMRTWTADELVTYWSVDADGILAAFVMVDDIGHYQRFRDVLVVIDKTSGGLVLQDASGLLTEG